MLLYYIVPLRQPTASDDIATVEAYIGHERLSKYTSKAGDPEKALNLYFWNIRFSAALMEMINIVEVALRNAMHKELKSLNNGPFRWYEVPDRYDDATQLRLTRAVAEATPPSVQGRTPARPVAGQVVAALTFGTWAALLNSGSYLTTATGAVQKDYDALLWRPGLYRALPGAKVRAEAYQAASLVNWLRNRVCHHEPLHYEVRLRGQFDADGTPRTMGPYDMRESILSLARMIDEDLGVWLGSADSAQELLRKMPG